MHDFIGCGGGIIVNVLCLAACALRFLEMEFDIISSPAVYIDVLRCWCSTVSKTYGLFDGFQDNIPDQGVTVLSRLGHANTRQIGDKERQSNNTKPNLPS